MKDDQGGEEVRIAFIVLPIAQPSAASPRRGRTRCGRLRWQQGFLQCAFFLRRSRECIYYGRGAIGPVKWWVR